jgi:hypothetical protein
MTWSVQHLGSGANIRRILMHPVCHRTPEYLLNETLVPQVQQRCLDDLFNAMISPLTHK